MLWLELPLMKVSSLLIGGRYNSLVIGCWLLVIGCWLLVVGCWFSAFYLLISCIY